MAGQRQIQDKQESTQSDSIENGAALQESADRAKESKKTAKSSKSATAKSSDNQPVQKLESLLQALQGDLSAIDPDVVLTTIEQSYSLVRQLKQPAATEIASGLKELQKLLKRKEPSGHELGELIGHLGEQTSNIASEAETEFKTPLHNLGKQLTKVARSLAKAEDLEHLEALDSLVDTLEAPDKTDSKSSIAQIDRWYDLLHKSDDEHLQQIATELKDLKKLLKGNKVKAAELSQQLLEIGELTTAAATTAQRGFKGVIQKLGKGITAFGKSLA